MITIGLVLVASVIAGLQGPLPPDPAPSLQARVAGEGPPVVLLGGGLLGADGWGGVPEELAKTHRVINLQSLAVQYGLERRPLPDGYSVQTEVAALGRTLDTMRVASADVIGMSHGGVVALVFALAHRDRVRTLTLIEPPAFWVLPDHGRGTPGAREMQAFVSSLKGREIGEEHVEQFRCLLGDCSGGRSARQAPQWPQWVKYRRSLAALHTLSDYDDDPDRLRGLDAPVLVVTGAKTVPFHRAMNEALLRLLPRAEPLDLPAGHNAPAAAPAAFAGSWRAFRQRAAGPAGSRR